MNLRIIWYAFIFMQTLSFTAPILAVGCEKDTIQEAIKTLSSGKSFVYYDLQLSDSEINALKSLKINSTEEYNNYGNLKALKAETKEFIRSLGNEDGAIPEMVSQIIPQLVEIIVQGSQQETAWVAVRSFTSMSSYDVPRWHTDGYYYDPYSGDPYKFAMTLKGPSTLFYKASNDMRQKFDALQNKGTEQNSGNRQALADLLGNSEEGVVVAQPYQGAVFIVGSENAAIHSEPSIKEDRLFLSVLPGSKKQIKEWEESKSK